MKIGIDVRLWDETGVGRYIRELVTNLSKVDKKNSYVLFCLSKNINEVKEVISKDTFKIVEADFHWHSLEEQFLFPMCIKNEDLDLMHFPYFSVPILYNYPFVVTIHDLIINSFSTGKASTLPFFVYQMKRLGYSAVINHALKSSCKIIVPLNSVKKDVLNKFHLNDIKVTVTYEGSPEKIDNKKNNSTFGYKKYFLHVGNVYPHKNCNRLIKSFKQIINKNPDVKMIFIGREDFFMQQLKNEVKKINIGKNVVFTGKITDEQLSSYYRNAIGVVIPSLMEGFGLPALEALTNSCLVIASDIPALKEVCADNAYYFDPYDEESIANTMEEVINLPAGKKKILLDRGIKHAKKYSWTTMAIKTVKIYESCIRVR